MAGTVTSRLAVLALAAAAIIAVEPRLHIAMESISDPSPRRLALSGEVMGKALGLVISWTGASGRLPIR